MADGGRTVYEGMLDPKWVDKVASWNNNKVGRGTAEAIDAIAADIVSGKLRRLPQEIVIRAVDGKVLDGRVGLVAARKAAKPVLGRVVYVDDGRTAVPPPPADTIRVAGPAIIPVTSLAAFATGDDQVELPLTAIATAPDGQDPVEELMATVKPALATFSKYAFGLAAAFKEAAATEARA